MTVPQLPLLTSGVLLLLSLSICRLGGKAEDVQVTAVSDEGGIAVRRQGTDLGEVLDRE